MRNGFLKCCAMSMMLGCSAVHASVTTSVIPPLKPGFGISLTGLYLQPSASNLGYAVYTNPLPLPAPNWQQQLVNPGYTGAFDLGLEYNLLNGTDQTKFDWLYFNSKDSASASSTPNTSIGPPYYYGPAEQFLLNTGANSTVKFTLDDGSLVFGHLINLTNNIQLEPFVGLGFAYLNQDITNNYFGTDPVYGAYTHSVYLKSKFVGIGPRLGLDSSYFVTNQFAITAEVAGDLLAGQVNYSTDFTSWTADTGSTFNHTPANTSMANQNQYRVVPEVGAKLAALYRIPLASNSELTLQAGYMFAVYFNATQQVLPTTLVSGSWEAGTVAIVNQTQQQSNVDLKGPFITASWKF